MSRLNFDDEPRVQERQESKDQQSWIFVFVAHLTITSSIYEHQNRLNNSIPGLEISTGHQTMTDEKTAKSDTKSPYT